MLLLPGSMLWPFLAALALTAVLVYFGIHVIGRQVIFVDLAMAQIAALGAAVGGVMGYELQHSPWGLFGYSLAFTLLAAFLFSITKMKSGDVPHEAIIGIAYAVAFAVTIVVLARSPLGPSELDKMMKGELLYVTDRKMGFPVAVFAGVGILHGVFWRKFHALSFGEPGKLGHPQAWDFLFYASLGLVVTTAVGIAGVFLVFCLLVIPAVGSMLFSRHPFVRLVSGWAGGAVLCLAGVKLSYHTGWPPSPAIVVAFAAALVLAGVVKFLLVAPSKPRAAAKLAAFAGVFALFSAGVWFFRHREEDPFDKAMHFAHSANEVEREIALDAFRERTDRKAEWIEPAIRMLDDPKADLRMKAMDLLIDVRETSAYPRIVRLLRDPDGAVQEHCLNRLPEMGLPDAAGELIRASREAKPDLRVKMLAAAMELGDRAAVDALFDMMQEGDVPGKWRARAADQVASHVEGFPQPLNPDEVKRDPKAPDPHRKWWAENRARLEWRDHKFR